MADYKDGFPAGDGIGANDRVYRGEIGTGVEWGTTRGGVHVEALGFSRLGKFGLGVRGGEGFEKFLIGSGESVVELVTGRPEGVYSDTKDDVSDQFIEWIARDQSGFAGSKAFMGNESNWKSRTSTHSREFHQSKNCVVARYWFESDV